MNKILTLVLILIVGILFLFGPLYSWYTPRVEIIVSEYHYKIYLWYNNWNGSVYIGRVRKLLFSTSKESAMKWLKFTIWFIATMSLFTWFGRMVSIANTTANISGLLIAVAYAVLSIKTRCFTTINLISNKNKNNEK